MKSGDSSSLDDMIDDMLDASSKLKDGSKELSDGLDTLQKNLADYASGMNELNSKSGDLGKGVETLNTSAESISKGIQTLDKALNTKMSDTEKQARQRPLPRRWQKSLQTEKRRKSQTRSMPHSVTAQEKMAAQRMAHYLLLFMMALIVQMQQKPCIMKW